MKERAMRTLSTSYKNRIRIRHRQIQGLRRFSVAPNMLFPLLVRFIVYRPIRTTFNAQSMTRRAYDPVIIEDMCSPEQLISKCMVDYITFPFNNCWLQHAGMSNLVEPKNESNSISWKSKRKMWSRSRKTRFDNNQMTLFCTNWTWGMKWQT